MSRFCYEDIARVFITTTKDSWIGDIILANNMQTIDLKCADCVRTLWDDSINFFLDTDPRTNNSGQWNECQFGCTLVPV